MKQTVLLSVLSMVLAGAAAGQSAGPVFEVASIKPNHSNSGRVMINRPDVGRFVTENTSLRMLITFAYDIRNSQLTGGPGWLETDRWDIVAKPETEVPRTPEGEKTLRKMMQALLAERFQLVVHKESKEMPVYAIVVAKGGPKLKASAADAKGPMMRMGMGTLEATKVPLSMLARALSDQVGRTVIDETRVAGDFDFKLEFAPDANGPMARMAAAEGKERPETPPDSDRPTILAAVQEQLGLKLEARKAPVETVVVDKVEKATEN
jgi:bla regulator protein blaR1